MVFFIQFFIFLSARDFTDNYDMAIFEPDFVRETVYGQKTEKLIIFGLTILSLRDRAYTHVYTQCAIILIVLMF